MTEPDHELTKEEQWKQMEAQAVAEMEAQERRRQDEEVSVAECCKAGEVTFLLIVAEKEE